MKKKKTGLLVGILFLIASIICFIVAIYLLLFSEKKSPIKYEEMVKLDNLELYQFKEFSNKNEGDTKTYPKSTFSIVPFEINNQKFEITLYQNYSYDSMNIPKGPIKFNDIVIHEYAYTKMPTIQVFNGVVLIWIHTENDIYGDVFAAYSLATGKELFKHITEDVIDETNKFLELQSMDLENFNENYKIEDNSIIIKMSRLTSDYTLDDGESDFELCDSNITFDDNTIVNAYYRISYLKDGTFSKPVIINESIETLGKLKEFCK